MNPIENLKNGGNVNTPKKLREFLGDKGLFDETQKAYKVPVEPFQNKSPKWDKIVANEEVFTLNKLKDWNLSLIHI